LRGRPGCAMLMDAVGASARSPERTKALAARVKFRRPIRLLGVPLSGLARKFAHVSRRGSGGEGGDSGVGLGEELVEVLAGKLPLEGRGDLLVASAEGE
jgi:hypothetical protein